MRFRVSGLVVSRCWNPLDVGRGAIPGGKGDRIEQKVSVPGLQCRPHRFGPHRRIPFLKEDNMSRLTTSAASGALATGAAALALLGARRGECRPARLPGTRTWRHGMQARSFLGRWI